MTQIINLAWQASGDAAAPFATQQCAFLSDTTWRFNLSGYYLDKSKSPRGVTVDNSANAGQVIVSFGPVSIAVKQYAIQTINFPNGTVSCVVVGTIGTATLIFFDENPAPTADGQNQYAIQQSAAQTSALLNSSAMNPIINSDFSVWPESPTFSVSGALGFYVCEGWQVGRTSGTASCQRASGITNSQFSGQFGRPAGDATTGPVTVWQQLQTIDALPFAGNTVTLAFDAICGGNFSAAGAALTVAVYSGTGTDQNWQNGGGFTGNNLCASQAFTLTQSGQRLSMQVPVPSTATQLAIAFSYVPVGTAGTQDWFRVGRLQFDIGSTPSAYRPVPQEFEQLRCKRFFELLNDTSLGDFTFTSGYVFNSSGGAGKVPCVPKRAVPTISFVGNFYLFCPDGSIVGTPSANLIGKEGFQLVVAASLTTQPAACLLRGGNPTIGQIKVNARL